MTFAVSLASAASTPVTNAATNITSSDATLNATNGDTAATGSSFWVSTSTPIDTSDPNNIPSGVYSTPDLGAQAASSSFSAQLSSATGLPAVTPGTTYYYVAWANIGGTWTPDSELSVTTLPSTPTVTSISPTGGSTAGGTTVTVTGTNLSGATSVKFGATPATSINVASSTSLTAVSPAGSAGTVDVTVTTPGGTSATSSADQFTYTAPLAPTITNVNVTNIGTSTATVTWNTDTPASSQVNYGTSASYGSSTPLDTTATTSHSVMISGLSEATFYHVQAVSSNAVGTTTSSDVAFVTASTASTTPLAVTSIDAIRTQAIADDNFSDGWEWIIHFVVPSVETNFSMKFSDFMSQVGSSTIPAANDIRYYSPESSNASTTDSAIVETNNDYNGTMTLTGDTSPAPGRQIDVYVQVKVPNGTPTGSYSTTFGAKSTQ